MVRIVVAVRAVRAMRCLGVVTVVVRRVMVVTHPTTLPPSRE